MRARISRDSLLAALSHSINIVDKRPAIPILSHILIEFADGNVILKATDLDHSLVETVDAEIDTFGSVTVSVQMLYDVVRKINGPVVEISLAERGEKIQVKSGKSKFEIQTLPAGDFPKIDLLNKNSDFEMPITGLKELIDKTKFSMAIEETRYNLNGIYFHVDPEIKNMIAVATDGHRLSVCKIENSGCLSAIGILARKTVIELRKLLDDAESENVKILKSSNQIQFVVDNVNLTARIVDAEFPKYEAVIPEINDGSRFTIDRTAFIEAIDRVSVISEDKAKSVRLSIDGDVLHLTSANLITGGSGQDEVKIQKTFEGNWEACFNARYLIDVASALACEELKVYVKDKLSSILILPNDEKECGMFVVMPMRI